MLYYSASGHTKREKKKRNFPIEIKNTQKINMLLEQILL